MLRFILAPITGSISRGFYSIRRWAIRRLLLIESSIGLSRHDILTAPHGYLIDSIRYAVTGDNESLEVWVFHRGRYSMSPNPASYVGFVRQRSIEIFFRGVPNLGKIHISKDHSLDRAALNPRSEHSFIGERGPGKFGFHAGLQPELGHIAERMFAQAAPAWWGRALDVSLLHLPVPADTTTQDGAANPGDPFDSNYARNYSSLEVDRYRSRIYSRKEWKHLLLWRAYWYIPGFHKLVKIAS